jgi:hypothetical protein
MGVDVSIQAACAIAFALIGPFLGLASYRFLSGLRNRDGREVYPATLTTLLGVMYAVNMLVLYRDREEERIMLSLILLGVVVYFLCIIAVLVTKNQNPSVAKIVLSPEPLLIRLLMVLSFILPIVLGVSYLFFNIQLI